MADDMTDDPSRVDCRARMAADIAEFPVISGELRLIARESRMIVSDCNGRRALQEEIS